MGYVVGKEKKSGYSNYQYNRNCGSRNKIFFPCFFIVIEYRRFFVNKSFLKDKRLTVTLYARNIFNKYRTYSNTIDAETFKNSSKSRIYQLSWGVSVNWRFGKLESQVKRTNRSINNDDVKSGGGGDSGSGK